MKQSLDKELILEGLQDTIFSRNFLLYKSIGSTNTAAKELAITGAPEGILVLAEEQTSGKGRMDRRWLSRGGENLIFTILLRPTLKADNIFLLTMILAISTIDAVKEMAGLDILIKWPNDLYVDGKKLAGILTEFSIKDGTVEYVIIGQGLNVGWMPQETEGIPYPATSILAETGLTVSRNDLLISILKRFEKTYRQALAGNKEDLHTRWNKLSLVIGRDVEIISPDEIIRGKAIAIDHDGALILQNSTGDVIKILSGDVSLRM